MKNIRKFETGAERDAWLVSDDFVYPNVVLTEGQVGYNLEMDYSTLPLHIEAIENLTVTFSNNYEYSKDNTTWSSGTSSTAISANAGEKVYFRASGLTPSDNAGIGRFAISNGKCNVAGNVMSMAYGADFKGQKVITINYQFYLLFYKCFSIVDASNLVIPATTLASHCYSGMFSSCTSLVNAPALPATTLVNYCYESMFNGCTSLSFIKAMFTTKPSSSYTSDWVNGVSATGTFVKNAAATWNVTGVNGIPSGWTVETAES